MHNRSSKCASSNTALSTEFRYPFINTQKLFAMVKSISIFIHSLFIKANGPYILYSISFKYGFSRLVVLPIDFDSLIVSFSFVFEKLVLLTLRSIRE